MSKLTTTFLTALCLSSPVVATGCALASSTQPEAVAVQAEPFTLNLEKGEILQLILVRSKDGEPAKAARSEYFRTVSPVASDLGGQNHGFMPIAGTLVGELKPQGVSVFTFPNQEAQDQFRSNPDWEAFKQLRREAWDQLDVFSIEVPEDMTLSFDPAKSYTIAAAWTRPGTMPAYQRYLDGIEEDFPEIGARYVAQMNGVQLQSQTETVGDPSQLTIVEWSDGPDLRALQRTQAYKDHVDDFQSAITRFDLYAFNAPKG